MWPTSCGAPPHKAVQSTPSPAISPTALRPFGRDATLHCIERVCILGTTQLMSRRAPGSYNRDARDLTQSTALLDSWSCVGKMQRDTAVYTPAFLGGAALPAVGALRQRQAAAWVRPQAAVTRPRGDTSFVDGALWGPRPCGWPHESGAGRQTNWDTAGGPDSHRRILTLVAGAGGCLGTVGSCINDLARGSGPPARSGVLDSPLQQPSNRRGSAVPGGPMGVPTASTALSFPVRGRLAAQPACPCLPTTGTPARVPRRMTGRQPKSSGRASTSR